MEKNKLGIYIHIPFCRSKCPYCDFYSVILKTSDRNSGDKAEIIKKDRIVKTRTYETSDCQIDTIGTASEPDADKNFAPIIQEGEQISDEAVNTKAGGGECLTDRYVKSLIKEIDDFFGSSYDSETIDTIYFGGGTPCLIPSFYLELILGKIAGNIIKAGRKIDCYEESVQSSFESENAEIVKDILKNTEITIEVNPKDISYEKLLELKKIGFNRLSIGMQSFDDIVLKKLGRRHRCADNMQTFESARKAGFENISIDLMFGIPGQSFESWQETISEAVRLNPEHISLYSLEFMEGTAFTRMLEEGKITETDPELDRKMYHTALELFEENGLVQYEISNVSKPGFESRHNKKYWNLDEYIGFGASAHSFTGNRRFSNAADIELYIDNPTSRIIYEENTVFDDMSEYVFTGLRKNEGINLNDFRERFGMDIWAAFDTALPEFINFVKDGYAELSEDRMRLTVKGFDISNRILCLFV